MYRNQLLNLMDFNFEAYVKLHCPTDTVTVNRCVVKYITRYMYLLKCMSTH